MFLKTLKYINYNLMKIRIQDFLDQVIAVSMNSSFTLFSFIKSLTINYLDLCCLAIMSTAKNQVKHVKM